MNVSTNAAAQIQKLRQIHMPTERDHQLKKHLYRLFEVNSEGQLTSVPCRYTAGQETRGVILIEEPGGGKTTAVRTVLKEAEFLAQNPETGEPRYLEIQVPSPATLKSVGFAILAALGLEGLSPKTTEGEIWATVRQRLRVAGIRVLWLDEAQDLIMARSANETENSLRMIKSLMQGDNAVIPVLSGTRRLGEVAAFDPQVSRRFTKIMPSNLQHGVDEAGLISLVEYYCNEAAIKARVDTDVMARLITASRHRFGRGIDTIINAIECALWEGDKTLTVDHFSEAWAMQEGCDPSANVFLSDHWLSIHLDTGAEEYDEARTKRQKKKLERV
ncbi:TniB family NTP-binding protein [Roseovarius sp. M141]|uniref:TniB family NTP-binding protein n=1 Tax=Roseovarius sp. M141 TaxID=2583806 RepID=UPI0020CDF23D|nr:TniB family NTP-binding protein [Roseovarius sp. M141]MCQ0093519.1 AAA family ATPase [Roseovarius sp. M141]